MECNRAANFVDAYLDNELDPLHALEVETHLQECRKCAGLLESRKVLQEALRTKLPYYAAPASLRRRIIGRSVRPWKMAAAGLAAALMIALGGLCWIVAAGHGMPSREVVVAEAIESEHLRSLMLPEHLMDVVSSDKHTVKPWFVGKLPFAPPVVDLKGDGFPLMGGRMEIVGGRPAAGLVYGRDKHIINVFVYSTEDADAGPAAFTTAQNHHVVHWTQYHLAFWAISDLEANELWRFAELVRGAM